MHSWLLMPIIQKSPFLLYRSLKSVTVTFLFTVMLLSV